MNDVHKSSQNSNTLRRLCVWCKSRWCVSELLMMNAVIDPGYVSDSHITLFVLLFCSQGNTVLSTATVSLRDVSHLQVNDVQRCFEEQVN